jgi:hypothetical protein
MRTSILSTFLSLIAVTALGGCQSASHPAAKPVKPTSPAAPAPSTPTPEPPTDELPPAPDAGTPAPATPSGPAPSEITPAALPSAVFIPLKDSAGAHAELCANDGLHPNFPNDADLITKTFCQDLVPGGTIPTPHGIVDLQAQLGLSFKNPNGGNAVGGNPGFAITGHSSSLVSRFVSALNPRAIVFTPLNPNGTKPSNFAMLAFTRGEQFAEVAVLDPTLNTINLYLVRFTQDCTTSSQGCQPSDLLTPAVEKNWRQVDVYESSTAINNTVADCLQCHQPDGPNGTKILRMQELTRPYTHFFSTNTDGGRALLSDFHAAHGTQEDYGPIPASMIDKADPALLAQFLFQTGFAKQPNPFPSALIESEVRASAVGQPGINVPVGQSVTWQSLYSQAQGKFIAPPYHDVKVTDPVKLAANTLLYRNVMAGSAPLSALTDIRDVFLADGLRDMGFAPPAQLNGRGLITSMCTQCHNSRLDQTLTRARFNAEQLDQMPRAEKDKAISRLGADPSAAELMPPALFRTITSAERQLMIDELKN